MLIQVGLILLAGAASTVRGEEAPLLTLKHTIELPDVRGRIDHLSLDARAARLFVAALGNDTVEVLDVEAGRRQRSIRGLAEPQGLLVVPERNRLFVANGRAGDLRVFDAASFAPLAAYGLGDDPDNVRLDPASGLVWVGYGAGSLAAIDREGSKVADIALGAHPESFQIEKGGPRIFVNLPGARSVGVVDRDEGEVIASWSTGDSSANFPMALDEADRRLFVGCRRPARLLVLDTGSGAIVAEPATVGDADDVFYDAATRRIYVSGGEGALAAYRQDDPDHYGEISRTETVPGARTSLFSPERGELYLAVRRQGQSPAAIRVYGVAR